MVINHLLLILDDINERLCISDDYLSVKEAAVGERIAYWIRTPQVPGSRPG